MTIELADGTKLRRDFKLPEEDVDCLDALRLKWETINEGGAKWVIPNLRKIGPIDAERSAEFVRFARAQYGDCAKDLPPEWPH